MFFNSKPKLNSKVRFQNREFKHQLEQARHYRRPVAASTSQSLLKKIFKNPYFYLIVLILSTVVYSFYFANFLLIKNIEVNGLEPDKRDQLKTEILNLFSKRTLFIKNNNFFLLSKNKLKNNILSIDLDVLEVSSIKKIFPSKLVVNVTERKKCFSIPAENLIFTVSCDGVVTEQNLNQNTSTPKFLTLKLSSNISPTVGEKIIDNQTATQLAQITAKALPLPNPGIQEIDIGPASGKSITIITQNNAQIQFDSDQSIDESLEKLQLIIADLSDSQKNNLYYIDLRLNDKGYVCLKNTPCALPTNFATATSTSTSTLNTTK